MMAAYMIASRDNACAWWWSVEKYFVECGASQEIAWKRAERSELDRKLRYLARGPFFLGGMRQGRKNVASF